jgi:hypothetical protein
MSSINIAGDTSGSISLTVPSVAGSNTVTIPASSGSVMVSGNMPAFSAYQTGTQTVTASTYTKVQFNAEYFDTANSFDSTTNYRFTPQVAGYYQLNASLDEEPASGSSSIFIGLFYKNGSEFIRFFDIRVSSTLIKASGSALVYLNGTTDYIEVYAYVNGTTPSVSGGIFNGLLVRTA